MCRLATAAGSEEACLCVQDDTIFAILVRQGAGGATQQGWYLLAGFGPCEGEGLIFDRLEQALHWVAERTGESSGPPASSRGLSRVRCALNQDGQGCDEGLDGISSRAWSEQSV